MRVEMPKKIVHLFAKPARYRIAYGGRGSGKSYNFARMLTIRAAEKPLRVLCAREFQSSIRQSVHHEIMRAAESLPKIKPLYDIGETYIRGTNGSEFIFKGLHNNYAEIKSLSDVDICWVEEAEAVSDASWRVLIPTIRKAGSEIWMTFNPESSDSATYRRFVKERPHRTCRVKMNFHDNPWFSQELEDERLHDLNRDSDMYAHVWLGEPLTRSDAQVLGGRWCVEEFEPTRDWDGPYYGVDFGFSQDPTAGTKSWIHADQLWIEHDFSRTALELDATPRALIEALPGIEKQISYGDSARPETINHLKSHGLPLMRPCLKGPGSVEDGIAFLRSFKRIVIHPRCSATQKEMRLYSYKIDRHTGDVTGQIIDANNHVIDSLRYGLCQAIKNRNVSGLRGVM